jgi:hypothetical protein
MGKSPSSKLKIATITLQNKTKKRTMKVRFLIDLKLIKAQWILIEFIYI